MSHLPWQTSYAHSQSSGGDSEIEALQTDVMRFMAILGLCLMAIFSLVQSLPYQSAEQSPQLESKELLEIEVKQLEKNAAKLQEKIKQYTETLQKVQDAKLQMQDAKQQAEDAKQEVEDIKQELEDIEQSVVGQRGRLAQLNKTVQQEQQALSSVRKKLEREKRIHQRHKEKLKKVIKKQEPVKPIKQKEPIKQKPVEQKPVEPTTPKEEKKGFSLRFTSDQTLLHLIQQQKINMYILMGKNAWHIRPNAGTWQVKKIKQPKKYYQMAVQTVPNILRKAAQNQLSVHERSQVIWAVELPESIASSISSLMQTKQGGDLVITQNGKVQLE